MRFPSQHTPMGNVEDARHAIDAQRKAANQQHLRSLVLGLGNLGAQTGLGIWRGLDRGRALDQDQQQHKDWMQFRSGDAYMRDAQKRRELEFDKSRAGVADQRYEQLRSDAREDKDRGLRIAAAEAALRDADAKVERQRLEGDDISRRSRESYDAYLQDMARRDLLNRSMAADRRSEAEDRRRYERAQERLDDQQFQAGQENRLAAEMALRKAEQADRSLDLSDPIQQARMKDVLDQQSALGPGSKLVGTPEGAALFNLLSQAELDNVTALSALDPRELSGVLEQYGTSQPDFDALSRAMRQLYGSQVPGHLEPGFMKPDPEVYNQIFGDQRGRGEGADQSWGPPVGPPLPPGMGPAGDAELDAAIDFLRKRNRGLDRFLGGEADPYVDFLRKQNRGLDRFLDSDREVSTRVIDFLRKRNRGLDRFLGDDASP